MDDPRKTYSAAQQKRIAKDARRTASHEAAAIFSAGGAAVAVSLFVFGFPGLATLKALTGLPEAGIWIAMAFGLSGVIALIHLPIARRTISRARTLHASFLHAHEREEREKIQARIDEMKGAVK